jgi:demethylmenaquinone methyltransferase/2-methoxy-6-polyprenyl-1,4-benzoquinol methylase
MLTALVYGPSPMADRPSNRRMAPFGAADVEASSKQTMVNEVFAKVASKYDQMNDLMSFGLHRLWKDDLVAMLNPPRTARPFEVLDLAGGTGDIAWRILRAGGTGVRVTLADISPAMLAEGRRRIAAERLARRCRFAVTNAEALAFRSAAFDALTIGFGIRNVTDIGQALREAYRVLRPGGRFLCLEFSRVDVPVIETLYDLYSLTTIPALGKIVTGDGQPYRYLVESIRRFPDAASFAGKMEDAGFSQVSFRILSAGVVAIHSGWRT